MRNYHMDEATRKRSRRDGEEDRISDIPVDILHDILARVDPATLVRCAAASKLLRRRITDPSFLRHCRAEAAAGSVLVGMFHGDLGTRFFPVWPSKISCKLTLPLTGCEPVASRAGLVLLGSHNNVDNPFELCVCSPVTGRCSTMLPATTMTQEYDNCLLLPAAGDDDDDGGGKISFRLLLVDPSRSTQIFSSRTGAWGPVIESPAAAAAGRGYMPVQPGAVVLHGVAHWLYRRKPSGRSEEESYQVLAVDIDTGHATTIEIPQYCLRRRRKNCFPQKKELLLVADDERRRLSLLVVEIASISIWTLSSSEEDSAAGTGSRRSWGDRRVVMTMSTMLQSVKLQCNPLASLHVDLEWFGEASGAVIFQRQGAGIIVLDLKTKGMIQLTRHRRSTPFESILPYEMDLVSMLGALKPLVTYRKCYSI